MQSPELLPGTPFPRNVLPNRPEEQILPGTQNHMQGGDFPALPPDPYASDREWLPPLEEELWQHGGAHLYEPEGDRRNWSNHAGEHHELLRLPENWQKPRPVTAFQEFLGADPIRAWPCLRWPGPNGYSWEPRFVGYGSYQIFGFALEENNQRQDVIGHQLLVDLDLRLTGTERFHVQYRPLGEQFTGGSYYQFSDPEGYVNNGTAEPDRYWFEGEVQSVFGGLLDPFAPLDYHFTIGRIPFALQNGLLMNDEFHGIVINKNNINLGPLSNLNIQAVYGFNDVTAYQDSDGRLLACNAFADYDRTFYEGTYAFVQHDVDSARDAHYAALSRVKMYGPLSIAARAMFKWGDRGGTGSGQLFVMESNWTRVFDCQPMGIEKGVFYCNAFLATPGWTPIATGNFNRLTTSFEVDPLVQIAAGRLPGDVWGGAVGVQLLRHHEDESLIPEFAFQSPTDIPVWGFGLRYLRKTSSRTFFELLSVINFSDDPRFDREGLFLSETILF